MDTLRFISKHFNVIGALVLISLNTSAIAADMIDITTAEISAILKNQDLLQRLRHNLSEPPKEGIVQIDRNGSDYFVHITKSCWVTVKVKSHVDPSSDKVIVESVKPQAGACD